MPESPASPKQPVATRREKFRAYMKNFNPTAPARDAIDSGLVLEDLHNSLSRSLAARADLEPGSQQLLAGGIGSGKTTQLLLAEKWLNAEGNTAPLFIDIAAETDLSGLNSGVLLAAFGRHLVRASSEHVQAISSQQRPTAMTQMPKSILTVAAEANLSRRRLDAVTQARQRVGELCLGKTEFELSEQPQEGLMGTLFEGRRVPGKLPPLAPLLHTRSQETRQALRVLLAALRDLSYEVVVIFGWTGPPDYFGQVLGRRRT